MERGCPRDADSAMPWDGVARHSVIGLGRRDPRSSGVKAEIGLAGTGGRVNGVGAREFDKHIIFGDAVLDRLERAERLPERAPCQCVVTRRRKPFWRAGYLPAPADHRLAAQDRALGRQPRNAARMSVSPPVLTDENSTAPDGHAPT